jgi:RHH-type proline utilization regulon transcriptional repressor/proline dehydrogenase/delta 1-pyrroline-5-carboxylate dehydrogenase
MANTVSDNLWPTIKEKKITVNNESWSFYYYEEYENVLGDDEILSDVLSPYCAKHFSSHRAQINIKSTPLLFGFFIEEKTICSYTARLGRELFLIENIEISKGENDSVGELSLNSNYQSFKKYSERVASLDLGSFPSQHDLSTYRYKLDQIINNQEYMDLDTEVAKLIESLRKNLFSYKTSLFERMSDFGLDLTARYALLRIHLLKFLAILPNLDHDKRGTEVKRILIESFRRLCLDSRKAKRLQAKGQDAGLPNWLYYCIRFGYYVARIFPAGPLAILIRFSVRLMATRFIAGENIESVEKSFSALFNSGRDVTLDQLGELVVSEKEADHYRDEVIKLIKGFGQYITKGEKNTAGINRAHVSIKVSALCSDFKPYAKDYTYKLVAPRLIEILTIAKANEVFINIDAEHYDYRDLVLYIYRKVLLETDELKDFSQTGIVLQAYLRDGAEHLGDIVSLAKERGQRMPIRIVKGAYWDAETVEANAHSFNAPEFLNKEETDLNFRQLIIEIFKNDPHVQLCLASHNFEDHCFAVALRSQKYSHIPIIEHQCLHMTYEALSTSLVKMGWPTRNYVPVGSLLVGMAYLVRRIMENSSQVGVLTIMRSHKKMGRLEGPGIVHARNKQDRELNLDLTLESLTSDFFNVTPARLYLADDINAVLVALEKFKNNDLEKVYNEKNNYNGEDFKVDCSSDPSITVGIIKHATKEDALKATQKVHDAFEKGEWSNCHWIKRASCLIKAADLMLATRAELSALVVYESGKSIIEALGDVDEAIDFLNFYARSEQMIHLTGEDPKARGPICAITPWNFPIAIPTGMISAPLVAGNTVVLKSAEQTPLIAAALVDLLHAAGVPEDVLVYVPGSGSVIGSTLVENNHFAGQVFTGSKRVGLMIAHSASKKMFNNKNLDKEYPVKAITEMGGKNAIIVTTNAELDETVSGILYSSFAHAGQKCSAASRIIVDESIKDSLIKRLREACQDIEVSEAYNVSCAVNPVITLKEKERLIREVKLASEEAAACGGRVIINRSDDDLPGYCVGPSVIELPAHAAMKEDSFARRELFGPVVHIISFKGLDQALEIFNCTDYALTGGVFSQSQDDIDYLTAKMECGNIYINRSITGARVAIEPFGGFKLSGTGPKAGSKSYVSSFHYFNNDFLETEHELCAGSQYDFDLCRPSGLWTKPRLKKVVSGLDQIIGRFEVLYGTIGEDKKELKDFQKWIKRNGEKFIMKSHANREIPGQLCYSDFSRTGEYAVIAASSDRPHLFVIFQAISALCMGVGLTVMCRSDKSYAWWMSFHNYFSKVGLSKENFNVFLTSEELFNEKIKDPLISYIIVDGNKKWLKIINDLVFDDSYSEKRMRLILTPYDAFHITDYKRHFLTYSWVRAFAVNTMRHGAPLEISIKE